MTNEVITALGLDKQNMDGHFISIIEQNSANANYLISNIMGDRILNHNSAICLVMFHNTFSHYHNVGLKLGYNLKSMFDSNRLQTYEPIATVVNNLEQNDDNKNDVLNEDQLSSELVASDEDLLNENKERIVHLIYQKIQMQLDKLLEANKRVCVIIDDFTHLLDLNIPLKDLLAFLQYLDDLRYKHNRASDISILCGAHMSKVSRQESILSNCLNYLCDLSVFVDELKTGKSRDANGTMRICWNKHARKTNLEYLFKTHDRRIELFTPGSI